MEHNELETMQNPDTWPNWFILPLKKHDNKYPEDIGLLTLKGYLIEADHWTPPQKPTVYLISMYELTDYKDPDCPKKILFEKIPHKTYESWEELLGDGWIVD
jgi:hypothetical protein